MAPNEQTPLIAVVHVAPPRPRYANHTVRRFCTFLLAVPLILAALLVALFLIVDENDSFGDHPAVGKLAHRPHHPRHRHVPPHKSWPASDGLGYDEIKKILLETPDAETARKWSKWYTSGPHLAGKNRTQAEWTRDRWEEFGVRSEINTYDVYINYPRDHGLKLLRDGAVVFKASLEEDVLVEDPTTGLGNRIPTFHGYSASGNVTAQYVYVNYGTYRDYEDLLDAGVDLKGKIALVKYGGIFRGLKVKRAGELGMVGVVIYSDPGDDGEVTEDNGYDPYPKGPARNPSSVQRGSVQYLSFAPGDPTTIGRPSLPGTHRDSANFSTPSIPSLPISYADALPILKALNGHGPNTTDFGERWSRGGLTSRGVRYNIGPSPSSVKLHLFNDQEYTITPLWNTIGIINGSISDEVVVVGGHRDAWIAGGAGDPNSGSSSLNEVVRAYGAVVKRGWKPQRTIVFASWDGEEYGLVGSTEWVEEYIPWLSKSAIAYLNVDVATRGTNLKINAAPLLDDGLVEVLKVISSPNQTVEGQSVYDLWDKHIGTMGSGSDFTAFQDFAGIPSIDLGFDSERTSAVYHYHSNYDSQTWMDRFGDPTFEYHVAISKILAILSFRLVEEPVIRFNASTYAHALQRYLASVQASALTLEGQGSAMLMDASLLNSTVSPLAKAIENLKQVSGDFDDYAAALAHKADNLARGSSLASDGYHRSARTLYALIRGVNDRYKRLERAFLHDGGLDGRSWFKHVVFAPGLWTGYAGATWPGLVESLQRGDKASVERWVGIGVQAVEKAIKTLEQA